MTEWKNFNIAEKNKENIHKNVNFNSLMEKFRFGFSFSFLFFFIFT